MQGLPAVHEVAAGRMHAGYLSSQAYGTPGRGFLVVAIP